MSDTVTPESLRALAVNVVVCDASRDDAATALRAAADEIERLTSDVADILTAANAEANRHD